MIDNVREMHGVSIRKTVERNKSDEKSRFGENFRLV